MANDSSTGGYLQTSSALPPSDAALDAIFQQLVVGITGMVGSLVRPRYQLIPQQVPEPTVDWCAIGVLDETPEQGAVNAFTVHEGGASGMDEGFSTTYENNDLNVLASFYGPNAMSNAAALRSGLGVSQNREQLYLQGIALVELPKRASKRPELINMQMQMRADLSLWFRRNIAEVWPIENLVAAQGTIVANNGVDTATETISVVQD